MLQNDVGIVQVGASGTAVSPVPVHWRETSIRFAACRKHNSDPRDIEMLTKAIIFLFVGIIEKRTRPLVPEGRDHTKLHQLIANAHSATYSCYFYQNLILMLTLADPAQMVAQNNVATTAHYYTLQRPPFWLHLTTLWLSDKRYQGKYYLYE